MLIIVITLLALLTFLFFLFYPSKFSLGLAVLGFGISQSFYPQHPQTAIYLYPVYLTIVTIFYVYSVIRDWKSTDKERRLKRFKIRAFRYYKALGIILLSGFVVALIASFVSFLY